MELYGMNITNKIPISIVVLLASVANAGTYVTSIDWRTTKGNLVRHLHLKGEDDARILHPLLADQVLRTWPSNTILKTATDNYNCHGYAHTNSHAWFNNDSVYGRFMQDDYYQFTPTKLKSGDIVVYGTLDNALHSAVVKSTDGGVRATELWSKWGKYPLISHNETNVPSEYGNIAFYMRKRSPILTEDDREVEIIEAREKTRSLLDKVLVQKSKFSVMLANSTDTVEHHIRSIPHLLELRLTGKVGAEIILERLKTETDAQYSAILIYLLKRMDYKSALPELARRVELLSGDSLDITDDLLFSTFEKLSKPNRKDYLQQLKQKAKHIRVESGQ